MSGMDNVGLQNGLGCMIPLVAIGLAIFFGYGWLDSIGWISHREDVVITAQSDWLVGESKECWSATLNSDGASRLGKETGYAMSYVSCDDGPEHNMNVRFYGRVVQGYKVVNWRCTKEQTSFMSDNTFTCYQTGGRD